MDAESLGMSKNSMCRFLTGILAAVAATACVGVAQDRGRLKIEGTHISRLVVRRDGGRVEKFTDPGRSVKLPVGTYHVQELHLCDGFVARSPASLGPIEVTAKAPGVLKAGGPLQQKVQVRRQGRTLVIDYRLLGIGGEAYGPPGSPDKRARFTVYRGSKAIGGGAFEYG